MVLLFFFFILQIPTHLTKAQPSFAFKVCSDDENYTSDSAYKTNLDHVMSSISNLASTAQYNGGFYNFSAGQDPDTAYALALCRSDMAPQSCYSCLDHSAHELIRKCPRQKEAIGWYDKCMLRYSHRNIFGSAETWPAFGLSNLVDVTPDANKFNKVLSSLLNCLAAAFEDMAGKVGGRISMPSCNTQYDKFILYGSALPPSSNSTNSTAGDEEKRTSRPIMIILLPFVIAVVVVNFIVLRLCKRRNKVESISMISSGFQAVDDIKSVESLQFQFKTIRDATDNFSDANKLGKGGFGVVYKGRLEDGQDIAVKRPWKESGQALAEFKNEVLLLAKLQHRNLIRLLGFCLKSDERLLVYEFVPNKSLDYFIFDPIKREDLGWDRRYKIIGGIARGLLYLHEDSRLRIIHRDLKASNVLLDADMNPKISDFGTARLFVSDQTQGNTMRIVGTYGYMAPEYAMHGHFSVKSDVFSFGVLVLEILSGHKNNSFYNSENEDLLNHAWRNWREGTALNVVDPVLRTGSSSEMMRCIHIALLCVQNNVSDRPTMNSVAHMLSSYSLTLPLPSQPVFYAETNMLPLDFSSQDQISVDQTRSKVFQ